ESNVVLGQIYVGIRLRLAIAVLARSLSTVRVEAQCRFEILQFAVDPAERVWKAREPEPLPVLLSKLHPFPQIADPFGEAALIEQRHSAHEQAEDDVIWQAQVARSLQGPIDRAMSRFVVELPGLKQSCECNRLQRMRSRPMLQQHRYRSAEV